MTNFEKWHEKQVYEKGDIQRKADIQVEKQISSPLVDVVEEKTGRKRQLRKCVADILKSKKQVSSPKLVFSVPDFSDIDWNK